MQLGMIGLGRMGANIVRRVVKDGHECVVYDHNPDAVKAMAGEDSTTGVSSLAELAEKLTTPRVVWVMVPAGDITTGVIEELAKTLESGRHRDRRRQLLLPRRSQARKDAVREGHSPIGLRHQRRRVGPRARLLPDDRRRRLTPSRMPSRSSPPSRPGSTRRRAPRAATARSRNAEKGYLHCGPSGAGHFVKMVHNGIEYGMMASLAEGLNILRNADIGTRVEKGDAETAPL